MCGGLVGGGREGRGSFSSSFLASIRFSCPVRHTHVTPALIIVCMIMNFVLNLGCCDPSWHAFS